MEDSSVCVWVFCLLLKTTCLSKFAIYLRARSAVGLDMKRKAALTISQLHFQVQNNSNNARKKKHVIR